MSPSPDEVRYPDITVHLSTGVNGNTLVLMAYVSAALLKAGVPREEVMEFEWGIFECESGDAALRHIMRTVNVT